MRIFLVMSVFWLTVGISLGMHLPKPQDSRREPIYHQFEEYDETMNAQQVIERLEGLAEYLKTNPASRVYLVSYGGRRSCYAEAQTRAALAKRYITERKGIDRRRVSILDAGYRNNWVVELWIGNASRHDPPPPRMRALDKSEVRITKKCDLERLNQPFTSRLARACQNTLKRLSRSVSAHSIFELILDKLGGNLQKFLIDSEFGRFISACSTICQLMPPAVRFIECAR